jgi:hypothetical protein
MGILVPIMGTFQRSDGVEPNFSLANEAGGMRPRAFDYRFLPGACGNCVWHWPPDELIVSVIGEDKEMTVSTRTACGTLFRIAVASMVLMGGAGAASAADMPKGEHEHQAPTKEMREKMATVHDQMAACLRSDKAIADCHKEMMKQCEDTMGKDNCPMMQMHHRMMKHHPADTTTPK